MYKINYKLQMQAAFGFGVVVPPAVSVFTGYCTVFAPYRKIPFHWCEFSEA